MSDINLQNKESKERRPSVIRESKKYFKTANVVINIFLTFIIVGGLILVMLRDFLWEKGWLY